MKSFIAFILLLGYSMIGTAQNEILEATIDNNCNVQPAKLSVASGKMVSSFHLISLIPGSNCYSGAKFTDKGFIIKNVSGDLVFKYQVNKDGQVFEPNGKLKDLKLSSGIYYIYVDGGKGAFVRLKYHTI